MRANDRPELDPLDKAGFASLSKVSLRRPAAGRDKKSDITDTLKSMRAPPEYLRPDGPVDGEDLRDVTPPTPGDIVDYWNQLRALRPMPPRDLLQVSDLAKRWPNLILFRCGSPDSLRPDSAFATALRAHRSGNAGNPFEGGAEISALLSQWILSVARTAATKSEPCRESSKFDTVSGQRHYNVAAVPFGAGPVDHVLCHVECADPVT